MAPRSKLQEKLVEILGTPNVYFQPPPTLAMKYPCIVYKKDDVRTEYADNSPYKQKTRYQVTVITKDPDNVISDKVGMLPLCSYDRFFTSDQLNHDVHNLFF